MHDTVVTIDTDTSTDHTLEFIERQLFYQYDEAYREYIINDLPRQQELRAYKEALDTITHIRNQLTQTRNRQLRNTATKVTHHLNID